MSFQEHLRTTGGALKRWFIAALQDAVAVGAMWFIGLLIIGIPMAPLWALLGGAFQFIPNVGAVLAVIGPVMSILFMENGDWMTLIYVLILYAIIAVVDGLILQPYLMRRNAKVPLWASIFVPIVLGLVLPFWGILLAPPLLAIYYTYRNRRQQAAVVDARPVGTQANLPQARMDQRPLPPRPPQ